MKRGLHSINNRLFLLFLFSMAGMLLVVSILYYNRTTVQVHDKVSHVSRQNVTQTVALFDLLLKGYNSLTKSVSSNTDLTRLLGKEVVTSPAIDYINERTITNIIGAIYLSRDDLVGIHILTDSGKVYNYGNYTSAVAVDYEQTEWYKRIRKSQGDMVWLGVYDHSIIDQVESRPVFTFGRVLYDLIDHKPYGIILIESKPITILTAMNNLKIGENSQVYLMSGDGRMISTTAPSGKFPDHLELPHPTNQSGAIVKENQGQLIVASRLPFADWTVISITPDKDLNLELVQTKRFLFIVVISLILLSALIASFVSRTLSSPLKRLIREMKQVEIGNFSRTLEVTSYQEINILVASFNHMVIRIGELIERVKISSVSEKNAELQALQTQVNPHFLYNTLDMIYWTLDEKGNDKLGEIVLSLSHMFRYSSHWDEGAEVTLREEVEQIRHYLTIIAARLGGRLSFEMDIDEQWMNIRLPKMTLQPIIENSVKYGLEPLTARPGVLRLSVNKEERCLKLMVSDNGIGLEEAALKQVRYSLTDEGIKDSRAGIGLQNLQLRLRNRFGEAYGIEVNSKPGEGAAVMIVLPLPQEGEHT